MLLPNQAHSYDTWLISSTESLSQDKVRTPYASDVEVFWEPGENVGSEESDVCLDADWKPLGFSPLT